MYYDVRNAFYRHRECSTIQGRNSKKISKQKPHNLPKYFQNQHVGKCFHCKGYDLKSNFNRTTQRTHIPCQNAKARNQHKMTPHKTNICAFTGLPFGSKSEMKPVGDHDHDTLLYRGHIWSAANRLEGAAKFIMDEAGWTVDELCDALKSYLAEPGMDIGLEPYPQLGFSTLEEAQQHYGC